MKKNLLLAMVAMLALVIMISHPGNAGAWGDPSLMYGENELERYAEAICLADLKYAYKMKYMFCLTTDVRRGKLARAVSAGEASLVIEDISYHLGDFGEYRHSGVMGWSFRVYCVSMAITPQGEFSKHSDIGCFIRVRDDGLQPMDIPKHLIPFR